MQIAGSGIVVTGAARGIGAGLAERFHQMGARVVLADVLRSDLEAVAATLNDRRPGSAWAVVADVSTESGNRELITTAEQLLGPSGIDLFFANAGVGIGTVLEATSEDEWNLCFAVNVHAHRWAAKHLVPRWLERGSGYFCSTASAAGLLSQIGSIPYSVTKSAAVAFAESLSITYGDRGIRVSCLCPQGVNTDMLRQGDSFGSGPATDVVRASGEVLEPDQVAEIVAQAIESEHFLILPHAQVADFEQRKAADRDRWLAGMRKLQARVLGGGPHGNTGSTPLK
ncbi:MAG: SDR family oxidoreductase [Ilumatobacteraceae bacterium]